jgi:outer membrane receptor protein involved in Fe transport
VTFTGGSSMRRLIASALVALVAGVALASARTAEAQEVAIASYERGPRFLLATATKVVPVDVGRTAVLARRLSLHLEGATLKEALAEITSRSGLRLAYSDDLVPLEKRVHLRADAITAAAALTDVLFDVGVDVVFRADGSAALVRRTEAEAVQEGVIVGRVTDRRTAGPIVGAAIEVQGTRLSATSGDDGRYRIPDVPAGQYTVRARYIGYMPGTVSVTVSGDEQATADFALEKSAQRLQEVVTTGTVIPTEEKALPTPVTVLTESDVREQRPRTVGELFRRAVPSAVSWADFGFPSFTNLSARGASTFAGGSMKVYLDGIEISNRLFAAIDPSSIERVEVVRGPQGSTIYGSEAIGGVIQVFTKRGDSTLTRPQVDVSSGLGIIQAPYDGYRSTLRQQFAGNVRGGGSGYSYNIGGSYTHVGEWVPNGGQSLPSLNAGLRVGRGALTLDFAGRYYEQRLGQTFNPLIMNTGSVSASRPYPWDLGYSNETLGARLTWIAVPWLRQHLTIGIDRAVTDAHQTGPRLTTPADTLLYIQDENQRKASVAYNAAALANLSRDVSANLVVGIDHYAYSHRLYYTSGALNTSDAITTAFPFTGNRIDVTNTGYFGQAQLSYRSSLFLTAGVRAEQNSSFGDALGTPVAPRVGLAYAATRGVTTVKVRGSYGEAIRPPDPGYSQAVPLAGGSRIANPQLGPERQKGWDAGVDLVFAGRASLSATYYDQTAQDLIQQVVLTLGPPFVSQYQNVGQVKNKGLELEGRVDAGPGRLTGQFAITDSRIEALAPGYTGDLRVGGRPFGQPKYTAGASLALFPLPGTTVTGGLTYAGSWTNYDNYALHACFGGTGPCQPTFGGYLTTYPGFVKFDVSATQTLTHGVDGFISVQNVGNNTAYENTNFIPVMGRITTIGVEAHY